MKIQLDTTTKTIKVEGIVSLLELVETLERLLPNGVWKSFSLECGSTIIWSTPQIVPFIYPTWPYYPWWTIPGTVTGDVIGYATGGGVTTPEGTQYTLTNVNGENGTYTLAQGTYNIEI